MIIVKSKFLLFCVFVFLISCNGHYGQNGLSALMAKMTAMTIMAVMVVMVIIAFLTPWSCLNPVWAGAGADLPTLTRIPKETTGNVFSRRK